MEVVALSRSLPLRALARLRPIERTHFLTPSSHPALTIQRSYASSNNGDSKDPDRKPKQEPEWSNSTNPKITLDSLGATRSVKIVIIVAFSIVATAESIFWIKTIWSWWAPSEVKPEQEEETS